jgi:hypothetical protein
MQEMEDLVFLDALDNLVQKEKVEFPDSLV